MKANSYFNERRTRVNLAIKKHYLVLTLFSIFSFVQSGFATDYYISSSTGNDSRSNAEAQNSATPWKSIDKLNAISSTLKGGDRILFKSGDVFYGTIKITKSGSTGAPIQFTSYGTGAKPIITSLVKLTNLVSVGGGKYEADLSAYNLNKVQIALVNDQIKEVGRYPNGNDPDGGYLRISSVNSATSFNTQSSNPFSGSTGDVVIRKNNWIIDRHAISSISGNTISFKPNESVYAPQNNYGYFLQNHASLLDLPGEWSYDPNSKKLTVNLTGLNISTVNVSVATLDNLVTNSQYTTNLTFSNLHFKASNSHLLNISRSENVKIENCLLEYAGENAISSLDVKGYVIQNNQINYALNSSIFIAYGSPGVIIRGNAITHNFPFQGMAKPSDMSGSGIFLGSDGDGGLIEKNSLINSGFNGIHFGGSYTKVINNFIDNFCLYKQDGGGIYTNSDGMRDRNNVGREITGNIILNGKGTKLGTTEEIDMAEGIYLDDNAAGLKISKNTIAHVSGKGLFLHNANNIEISENLFYKAKSQLQLTHDFMGDPIRNISVSKNQFSSIDKTNKVYAIYSSENDIGSVGSFSSNYFLDPFDNDFFILTKGSNDGPTGVSRNISNWATNFGYDANSQRPDLDVVNYKIKSSTVIKESDFSSNTSLISGVYGAASQLANGISGGTLKLTSNSSNNATAYIQVGEVKPGEKILVEFDMKGTPADMPVELFLEETYNQDKGAGNGKVSTTSAAKTNKVILTSMVAKGNESIVLRFPPSAKELLLDNIKISKVTTEDIDEKSLIFFAYNPTGTAVQKSLDGTYKNAKNETFTSVVSVPAYGSVLLAKISAVTAPVENKAPTITLSKPTQNQVFIQGVNPVELVTNAQDPEGKIKKVEFYSNGTLLTSVTAPPYSYNWTSIQNGNYQVYAKVIDEKDLSATSATVNFTVKNEDPVSPSYTAKMVAPINNATLELGSQPVVLKTNPAPAGITIKKVEFFNGKNSVATVSSGKSEYSWTSIKAGTYSITAKVTDTSGKVYTTGAVNFTVKNPAPAAPTYTAKMVAPINNSTFELGSQLVVLKTNTAPAGITIQKVEFFNGKNSVATVSSGKSEYSWTSIKAGTYSITAKVTDSTGKVYTTSAINFTVTAKATIAPPASLAINLTQPANNQTFTLGEQIVKLKADASGSAPIKNIQFYNWGFPLITVTKSPYEFDWTKIEAGDYQVYAVVTDVNGKTTTSQTVKFKVKAGSSETPNPGADKPAKPAAVVMTLPLNNQTFELGKNPVILKATTSETVSKVEFFNWYQPLVSVKNAAHEFNWSKIEVGEYFVSARITDSQGKVIDSAPVRFKVVSRNKRTTDGDSTATTPETPIADAEKDTDADSTNSSSETPIVDDEKDSDQAAELGEQHDASSYGIRMGPNPTDSQLNIFFDDYPENFDGVVSVLDLRGVELFKSDFSTNQETITLQLSFLKPGIYVVKLNFGNKYFQTHKLIKT